jgi:P pilus assembly chaperone PapD
MKRMKYIVFLLVSAAICFIGMNTYAQELEVSPGTLSFATNPGSSQTQQITLRNKGNTEQSFVFNLSDWLTDENGEVRYFNPGSTPRSCADWITVSPALVTLQPNEQATVNVTMLVPNDNSSTKWAVLFVQSAKEQTGPKAVDKDMALGVQVALRIAVTIYQSPASNTLYKGTIEGLTEQIGEDNSRTYSSQVINLGDKVLNCKVYFTITNLETAEEITSTPVEFSLLPETNKKVSYKHEKPLEKGKYSVAAILDYGFNNELEGVQLELDVK